MAHSSVPMGAHAPTPSHHSACAPHMTDAYAAKRVNESDVVSHALSVTAIVIALELFAAAARSSARRESTAFATAAG